MEIKRYRAIDRETNEFIYGYVAGPLSYDSKTGKISSYYFTKMKGFESSQTTVDADTISENIGRYDKDGTNIYTGDIIKLDNEFILEVCKDDETARYILTNHDDETCGFHSLNSKDIEVIGNIYKTPELLNKKEITNDFDEINL